MIELGTADVPPAPAFIPVGAHPQRHRSRQRRASVNTEPPHPSGYPQVMEVSTPASDLGLEVEETAARVPDRSRHVHKQRCELRDIEIQQIEVQHPLGSLPFPAEPALPARYGEPRGFYLSCAIGEAITKGKAAVNATH
jgi:hypothetical protein